MKTRLAILTVMSGLLGATASGYEADYFEGKVLIDGRLRYENAKQDGAKQSGAFTYRLRLGYEAQITEEINFLIEGEGTMDLGLDDYDAYPGSQGLAGHAVIADPQNLELNRAQIAFNLDPLKGAIGRQRIIRNNARYIGNVGWRQNEQTYDAITISYNPTADLSLFYGYLDAANRIFGIRADASVQRQFELDSHIMEVHYALSDGIETGLYGYLIGIENSAANSGDTWGAWATGKTPLKNADLSLDWRVEYARQSENHYSPDEADFELAYVHLLAGLSKTSLGSISVGYEILEGDGSRGFSTPLATLHAHNGFADLFLTTPADGLEDLYIKVSTTVSNKGKLTLIYHDFQAENSSSSYGKEYDLVFGWKIDKNLSVTAKFASFDGDLLPDATKIWLQLDMKY